jgi:hypothetical protein
LRKGWAFPNSSLLSGFRKLENPIAKYWSDLLSGSGKTEKAKADFADILLSLFQLLQNPKAKRAHEVGNQYAHHTAPFCFVQRAASRRHRGPSAYAQKLPSLFAQQSVAVLL